MRYSRFEDLPVWKAGMDLCERVYALVEDPAFRGKGDLSDQLRRAALSITNNIAEGFERGSTAELITFLYYARGSAGEVCSMLRFCERAPWWANLKSEISNLILLAENASRQLRGWADSLQNSEIKGQKYLTDTVRDAAHKENRVHAFLEKLERIRTGAERAEATSSFHDTDSQGGSEGSRASSQRTPEPPIDDCPWPTGAEGTP